VVQIFPVKLSDIELAKAKRLGDGNASRGIRRALENATGDDDA
jgi:hypothetical protein